jgi:hypothetical protein
MPEHSRECHDIVVHGKANMPEGSKRVRAILKTSVGSSLQNTGSGYINAMASAAI